MSTRKVTTQAELDALPVETVVRDSFGAVLQKLWGGPDSTWTYGGDVAYVSLPAEVIWEPKAGV